MPDDYFDAAHRHMRDGKVLQSATPRSLAGASHLFGFAAECALKAILQTGTSSKSPIKGHLPKFWQEFESHSSLARRHSIRAQATRERIRLATWDVSQRYHNRNDAACFAADIVANQEIAAGQLVKLANNVRRGIVA